MNKRLSIFLKGVLSIFVGIVLYKFNEYYVLRLVNAIVNSSEDVFWIKVFYPDIIPLSLELVGYVVVNYSFISLFLFFISTLLVIFLVGQRTIFTLMLSLLVMFFFILFIFLFSVTFAPYEMTMMLIMGVSITIFSIITWKLINLIRNE